MYEVKIVFSIYSVYTDSLCAAFYRSFPSRPFEGVDLSSIAFADVDGDNDQDVLVTDMLSNSFNVRISKLYTNDEVVYSMDVIKTGVILDLILFPNPAASGTLYLNYETSDYGEVTMKAYHMNGVLLKEKRVSAVLGQETFTIDIESFLSGNYLLELDDGKRKGVAKFIIQ